MTEFPKVLTMSDEDCTQYIRTCRQLLDDRHAAGALVSAYDFIAAACVTLFMAGRQDRIPADWIFIGVRPELLPEGVDMQVAKLSDALMTAREMADDIETMAEAATQAARAVANVRGRLDAAQSVANGIIGNLKKIA